jgi:hypothetical protein
MEVDFAQKSIRWLPLFSEIPKIARQTPSGIAFDARRQRVLVATNQNLFAYSPKTDKWEVVCEWLFARNPVLAYDPLADNIYALEEGTALTAR